MSKLEKLQHINIETGEILDEDIIRAIVSEEDRNYLKKIFGLYKNNPNLLQLEDIEKICKIRSIDNKRLIDFDMYHMVNDDSLSKLFDNNVSMKAYYYFGLLTTKYCSSTYTLIYNNNRHIEKDSDISKLLGISKSTWNAIKKELEDLKLLRRISFDGKNYYKINPLYVRKNRTITESTWFAFRDEIINSGKMPPIQILFWDKILEQDFNISPLLEKSHTYTYIGEKLYK